MKLIRLTLALLILPIGVYAQTNSSPILERYVAIDNVCAWPNLTLLPDGSIIATIHNQPSHGFDEGDVECWARTDVGKIWKYRGTPARHEPGTNRMNVAAGVAKNGDLIVLASGLFDPVKPGEKRSTARPKILEPWVCRSTDAGRTWKVTKQFPQVPGAQQLIPFGDILPAEDGSLRVSTYTVVGERLDTFMLRSHDDGRTWEYLSTISQNYGETAILHLGGDRWLAASRASGRGHVGLFESNDAGKTWRFTQQLTSEQQIPAHLLRLTDGRVLVTYGDRRPGHLGVEARLSSDEGQTWCEPIRLVESAHRDCGYPASIQRRDGKIVTAYYAASVKAHNRYHMGVVIWNASTSRP